jgi:uncharacterized protein
VNSLDAVTPENLQPLFAELDQIDILVIGAGRTGALPFGPFIDALRAAGLRPEMMDTPAAIRTYNVLLAEHRRVAAALLQIR